MGICEMLLAGVTTFLDMYYYEDEVAKACEDLGMRGFLGETVIGQATCESRSLTAAWSTGRVLSASGRTVPW